MMAGVTPAAAEVRPIVGHDQAFLVSRPLDARCSRTRSASVARLPSTLALTGYAAWPSPLLACLPERHSCLAPDGNQDLTDLTDRRDGQRIGEMTMEMLPPTRRDVADERGPDQNGAA